MEAGGGSGDDASDDSPPLGNDAKSFEDELMRILMCDEGEEMRKLLDSDQLGRVVLYKDERGRYALFHAVIYGSIKCLEALYDRMGAHFFDHAWIHEGMSAACAACWSGNVSVLYWLRDKLGEDFLLHGGGGESKPPIYHAIVQEKTDCVQAMYDICGHAALLQIYGTSSAAHIACAAGKYRVLEKLYDIGGERMLGSYDFIGNRPAYYAVKGHHVSVSHVFSYACISGD